MRWYPAMPPQGGDKRVRSGFLFFPKTARKELEAPSTRWLEYAVWEEEFHHIRGTRRTHRFWRAARWL